MAKNKRHEQFIIEVSRDQLLKLGLLFCVCGHPPNNHFLELDDCPCAHCGCKAYDEYVSGRIGRVISTS